MAVNIWWCGGSVLHNEALVGPPMKTEVDKKRAFTDTHSLHSHDAAATSTKILIKQQCINRLYVISALCYRSGKPCVPIRLKYIISVKETSFCVSSRSVDLLTVWIQPISLDTRVDLLTMNTAYKSGHKLLSSRMAENLSKYNFASYPPSKVLFVSSCPHIKMKHIVLTLSAGVGSGRGCRPSQRPNSTSVWENTMANPGEACNRLYCTVLSFAYFT